MYLANTSTRIHLSAKLATLDVNNAQGQVTHNAQNVQMVKCKYNSLIKHVSTNVLAIILNKVVSVKVNIVGLN